MALSIGRGGESVFAAFGREIEAMTAEDQAARFKMFSAKTKKERMAWGSEIRALDRRHVVRLKEILDASGWLGIREIGPVGSSQLWLLVQHADFDLNFQKKCLNLLAKAVIANNADPANFAYLTDRVCVNQGLPQIYGTQFDHQGHLKPLFDEKRVDERRRQMGLSSLLWYRVYSTFFTAFYTCLYRLIP